MAPARGLSKAILWSLVFEITGLGCGSGPLTGRYLPPFGGRSILRPGTTKLPVFKARAVGRRLQAHLARRRLVRIAIGALDRGVASAEVDRGLLIAIAVIVPALGVLDKTLFLCARGEHYWTTIMVMALAADFVPGAKGVHAALWFWAGDVEAESPFPNVVGVMTGNSPLRVSVDPAAGV